MTQGSVWFSCQAPPAEWKPQPPLTLQLLHPASNHRLSLHAGPEQLSAAVTMRALSMLCMASNAISPCHSLLPV